MILLLILAIGLLIFCGFCWFSYWLCTASTKVGKRMAESTEIKAQAMLQQAAAFRSETEAWDNATRAAERSTDAINRSTEAINRQAKSHEHEAEAWRQATEAEKSAAAAREREATAAEKIAEEIRAMNEDEQTEFFSRIFSPNKNFQGRHPAAPPGKGNFDRN